jgi:hypothetical protein
MKICSAVPELLNAYRQTDRRSDLSTFTAEMGTRRKRQQFLQNVQYGHDNRMGVVFLMELAVINEILEADE